MLLFLGGILTGVLATVGLVALFVYYVDKYVDPPSFGPW